MYLTYEEYKELGGDLDEPDFNRLERKASAKINYYTQNRLVNDYTIPDGVNIAMMDIIELFEKKNQYSDPDGGIVSSESNDDVSVSYANETANEFLDSFEKRVYEIIKENLIYAKNQAGTHLLYRGC